MGNSGPRTCTHDVACLLSTTHNTTLQLTLHYTTLTHIHTTHTQHTSWVTPNHPLSTSIEGPQQEATVQVATYVSLLFLFYFLLPLTMKVQYFMIQMSPGLMRAREPYRVKNMITGLTISSFAIGVWLYSMNAVKQDNFDDVDEEARAMARAGV
ncbi:hypothetical protein B0F90DRAFT_1684711, partial [Multifurca ochricompacta]